MLKQQTFEIMKKLVIDERDLTDLLSTAHCDTCGVAWWKEETPEEYATTREELIKEGNTEPALEEVWSRILFNGGKLMLLDPESDWHWKGHEDGEMLWNWQILAEDTEPEGGDWYHLGLEEIINGIKLYIQNTKGQIGQTVEEIIGNSDFWDCDSIIQYAIYGDVIYG